MNVSAQIGASGKDYILVSLHGLGDTYLIAALGMAFRKKYCQNGERLFLLVKESHRELAEMFDGIVVRVISMPRPQLAMAELQLSRQLIPGVAFCPHTEIVPVPELREVIHGSTHKNVLARLLGLGTTAPLALPIVSQSAKEEADGIVKTVGIKVGRTAIMFPTANSNPLLTKPDFWNKLCDALQCLGWHIIFNDENAMPLRCVIPLCEIAGWAIGADCGIMQMIVQAQSECRKTILFPANGDTSFLKVDGNWYDIEEQIVTGSDSDDLIIQQILHGRNARGFASQSRPFPLTEPMNSPGDIIDHLTILCVKHDKLPNKRHRFVRDIAMLEQFYFYLCQEHLGISEKRNALHAANVGAWDANEILISMRDCDAEVDGVVGFKAWLTADRFNQERVRLKNEINTLCGSRICEEKSYEYIRHIQT